MVGSPDETLGRADARPPDVTRGRDVKRVVLPLIVLSLAGGCSTRRISHTPRSAIEQLLLSAAVDKAVLKFDLPGARGMKVFTDFTNLNCYDKEYVRAAIRARVAELGCLLAAGAEDADLTVEVASGGLGTEYKESVIGLPALPVPNSPVGTPEAPAYRQEERTGIVKLLILVHAKGTPVSVGHYYAKADREEGFALGMRFQPTDEIREGWDKSEDSRKPLPAPPAAKPKPAEKPDATSQPKVGMGHWTAPAFLRWQR